MAYLSPYADVDIPNVSLPEYVMEGFADRASQPALIDGPTGRTLSYGELAGATQAFAAGLTARDFGRGDVFAIYMPNVPEYAVAFFGVTLAGGVVTTLNPLYTANEASHQLSDAGARFLLTVPPFLDKAQEAADGSDVEEVFVLGEAEGATPFTALMQQGDGAPGGTAPKLDLDPAEDLAALPYSSGTTGLPKGVMLTHRNLVANVCQCVPIEGIQPEEVTVGILPFYHIYGMTVILSMALRCGATIVTMPKFEMDDFCALVQQHEIESAYLVPPIILGLAKQPIIDNYDLSSLDYVTSGAAPLPVSVAEQCAERLGCMVKQGYGMTETSPVTHLVPRDEPGTPIDSVGRLVPMTEARVVDVSTGGDVEPGEKGELWIRGPQVMKGYLNNEAATGDTVDADGWLHTGDVAVVDEDEYTYIVDRVKELIKYKGFQVAPAELEEVLQSHDDIADAAVIPTPDEEAGELPKAFVVRKPHARDLTEDAVIEFVAGQVAPYKKVRIVEFVDEIPKTASGKILRRELVKSEREEREEAGS